MEKQLGIFTLHHIYIWILPFPSLLGELCTAEKWFWNCKNASRGRDGLWGTLILYVSGQKEFNRGKVVYKKWFIRIRCLWGLQAGGQEGLSWRTFYNFTIKGKLGKGGKPTSSSFLNKRQVSMITISSTSGRGSFCVLPWSSQDCYSAI